MVGLARCGFGASLLTGVQSLEKHALGSFIASWQANIVAELRSNSHGLLGKKHTKLAATFPHDFPDPEILAAYLTPTVSGSNGKVPQFDWRCKLNIPALAEVCARRLDWEGDEVLRRFKSLVWPGAVLRVLRDATLDGKHVTAVENAGQGDPGGPSIASTLGSSVPALASLAITIRGQRTHASTDYLPEYRLEVDPRHFMQYAMDGLHELHPRSPAPAGTLPINADETQAPHGRGEVPWASGSNNTVAERITTVAERGALFLVWLPACIVQLAVPQLAHTDNLGHTGKRVNKRRHESHVAPDNDAARVVHSGQRKMARRGGDGRQGDNKKLTRAHTPVIDLTGDSDSDVIVIFDSDDASDNGAGGSVNPWI